MSHTPSALNAVFRTTKLVARKALRPSAHFCFAGLIATALSCETLAQPTTSSVPGVVIDHSPASSGLYIGSPSIVILTNGNYLASHDLFGPNSGEFQSGRTVVFRSLDNGLTWGKVSEIQGAFWSSLFVHRGAVYLLGPDRHHGNGVIRRSVDEGTTWTSPTNSSTGLLSAIGEYHCAPMPVIEHNQRLWRAMELRHPPAGWGSNYGAGMLSVPVHADLLVASNWTFSQFLPSDRAWNGGDMGAWLEGNAVTTPSGELVDILRVHTKSSNEKAAMVRVSSDGKTMGFDPATGFLDFPGGAKKFTIRFDPVSHGSWSLVNAVPPDHRAENPSSIRNSLALVSSSNLLDWATHYVVLSHPDSSRHAFQYVDWLFEGDDLIAVSRTAFDDSEGGAHNAHDANFLTFHRIANFRTQETASTGLVAGEASDTVDDWPYYGHDAGGMRYSPLKQINRTNVSRLSVAWTFHTGDVSDGKARRKRSGFETTPLLVEGRLFLTTPFNRVIALDPETGQPFWSYDPKTDLGLNYGDGLINRGVASWSDSTSDPGKPGESRGRGRRRIFEATLDARLIALDAETGRPCSDFGQNGEVSLRNIPRYIPGQYHMTSPPAVVDDLVIVGSAIDDNSRVDMPSGVVRAFDARTGALRWSWDPLPPNSSDAANAGPKTWRTGAGNCWSIMAVDPARHLVFVPTGSASPDYYGGLRPGDDRWANSIVALHSQNGQLAWGFQLVHHDLWDYDCASPPLLATLARDGQDIPVVVQGNKTGFLYVLNRETGVPVFPVEERPVPPSDVPGEVSFPTQPFPSAPPPLVPQKLSADQAWAVNSTECDECRQRLGTLRNEGIFTPPSLKGSLVLPGNVGGMNWSGSAFDPSRNLLVANVNNLPAKVKLIPRAEFDARRQRTEKGEYTEQDGSPYGLFRNLLQAPSYLPCGPPPWGMLTAVDLAQGKIHWQVPLGSMQDFGGPHQNVPPGSVSLGGPIVTAGGLIFIAGTIDPFIRAFDVETGQQLWQAPLPASGAATPMTYCVRQGGRQFLVIAAGGHAKVEEEAQSDALVAFALP